MKSRKIFATLLLTGTLVAGGGVAAMATTNKPVEGGTWTFGYNAPAGTINSDYFHGDRCHGSTVESGDRNNNSGEIAAGYTAHSGLGWIQPWSLKNYFYRVC